MELMPAKLCQEIPLARKALSARVLGVLCLAGLASACQTIPAVDDQYSRLGERSERFVFAGQVTTLAFSRGGRVLIAGGCEIDDDGDEKQEDCPRSLMQRWNLDGSSSGKTLRFLQSTTALAVSPDGSHLAAGDAEGRLSLLKSTVKTRPRALHQKREITALAFSPDGKWVASGSLDTSFPLGFLETATGGVVKVKIDFEPISALAFSPDGKEVAIGTRKGGFFVWSFLSSATSSQLSPNSNEQQAVTKTTFSSDGNLLAYGRRDGRVVILDRKSGKSIREFKGNSAIKALAFSPDGQYLALGQDNGKVLLIESMQGRQVWSKRHLFPVADIAYSPDGGLLAVAARQHVYLYHVGESAELAPLNRAQGGSPNRESMAATMAGPQAVASQTFAKVLEISQREFLRLLPLDRLVASAVRAMVASVPGASVEPVESSRAYALVVKANNRVLSVDLVRLRRAEGGVGLREAVRTFETAQRFFLAAAPGTASRLEGVAVKAVVAELGPSVRLVRLSGESASASAEEGAQTAGDQVARLLEEDRVPYLKVSRFTASTTRQVDAWLRSVAAPRRPAGVPILDLRDNSGGELDSAVQTASLLLPKGQPVAGLILRKTGDRVEYHSRGGAPSQGPFVVLVNEWTAGTAEMLACAMRTAGVGVLVGTRTAGVDEVYQNFALPGGGELRISAARFDCPDGRSLRWKGQDVDLSIGRAPVIETVPVGGASSWSVPGGHRPVRMAVGLRRTSDRDLILGVQAALCLGSTHGEGGVPSHDQASARLKRHLASCGMSPS